MVGTLYAAPYGQAGCGLGSVVIGKEEGISQVFAATTNETFGSQLFGITSGTSNCQDVAKTMAFKGFIRDNKIAISNNIARGEGPELSTALNLLECKDKILAANELKKNYEQIFASYYDEYVADKIVQTLDQNSDLRQTCHLPSPMVSEDAPKISSNNLL